MERPTQESNYPTSRHIWHTRSPGCENEIRICLLLKALKAQLGLGLLEVLADLEIFYEIRRVPSCHWVQLQPRSVGKAPSRAGFEVKGSELRDSSCHDAEVGMKRSAFLSSLSLSLPGMGSGVCPPPPPHANAHLRVLAGFVSPRGYVHWGLGLTERAEKVLKCSQIRPGPFVISLSSSTQSRAGKQPTPRVSRPGLRRRL